MRITVDTNVLIRITVADDAEQASLSEALLRAAELIAIPLTALCEFVWVTTRVYRRDRREVAEAIRAFLAIPAVSVDRPAVEAGLALLDAGGDFADGVIGFEGRRLGGEVFASFDRDAVRLIAAIGGETRFLGRS
ncbi:MAG TPA: type II toxin-antitoxin system VapC family toxin [Stellaceae bacterium]|nr:type II toxin-antitoxin system VapC family toxin [Stellaceae bacterium]